MWAACLGSALQPSPILGRRPCPACRRRCVPLVCRRWAALVNTPELLAEVALGKDLKAHAAASLRSFIAWVVRRAAPHVRRLHLSLDLGGPGGGLDVLPTAVACALACCAFGGLDELSLCVLNGGLELGWAAALTSLRSLKIDAVDGCGVDIRQQMEHLTRMERLSLGRVPTAWMPLACMAATAPAIHNTAVLPNAQAGRRWSHGRRAPACLLHSPTLGWTPERTLSACARCAAQCHVSAAGVPCSQDLGQLPATSRCHCRGGCRLESWLTPHPCSCLCCPTWSACTSSTCTRALMVTRHCLISAA